VIAVIYPVVTVNTPLVNWSMVLEAAVEKCNVSANIIKNEVT